jgi:hypothetical protein
VKQPTRERNDSNVPHSDSFVGVDSGVTAGSG